MKNEKLLIHIGMLVVFFGAIMSCGSLAILMIYYYEQLLRWNLIIGLIIGLICCLYPIFIIIGIMTLSYMILRHEGIIKDKQSKL